MIPEFREKGIDLECETQKLQQAWQKVSALEGKKITLKQTYRRLQGSYIILDLMQRHVNHFPVFEALLTSFVNLARSVTWMLQKEAGRDTSLAEWYDKKSAEELSQDKLFTFFNETRRFAVHEGRIPTVGAIAFKVPNIPAGFKGRAAAVRYTGYGWEPIPEESLPDVKVGVTWFFQDWEGPEDIFTLSLRYLRKMSELLLEALQFIEDTESIESA